MRPETLCTVIRRTPDSLKIGSARLPNYRRYRIKKCNYPAIILFERGEAPDAGMVEDDEGVIGTYVEGLTDQDLAYLDEWEGDVSPLQAAIAGRSDESVR
jgi:hypothetical protein